MGSTVVKINVSSISGFDIRHKSSEHVMPGPVTATTLVDLLKLGDPEDRVDSISIEEHDDE